MHRVVTILTHAHMECFIQQFSEGNLQTNDAPALRKEKDFSGVFLSWADSSSVLEVSSETGKGFAFVGHNLHVPGL